MANPKHLAILEQGVEVWNRWRDENPDVEPDLSEQVFERKQWQAINLFSANLRSVELVGIDLNEADMTDCTLADSSITSVSVRRGHLVAANLAATRSLHVDFSGTDFRNADLTAAILRRCDFGDASFTRVTLYGSAFLETDLSSVRNLETCLHHGPSNLDHWTLLKSAHLPKSFFQGVGLPDKLIDYLPSLAQGAVEFYSSFISYSSNDQGFAERLHTDLQARNLRVWFAPEDLRIGDCFQERIEDSIRLYDKVMIVLSEASVQSRWVEREVNAAFEREERDKRLVLFPIRIDDAVIDAP